jgi:hypothetical protein
MATIPQAEEQPTVTLWPETGQALRLSRSATYDGAARGEIPTIRIGRRLLVPTAALRRMLQLDHNGPDT